MPDSFGSHGVLNGEDFGPMIAYLKADIHYIFSSFDVNLILYCFPFSLTRVSVRGF